MFKVIIVDDEEEVRKGIIKKIDWPKYNFEVIGEAENGREAVDLMEETIPDVVITDITMPLMDGLELSSLIQELFPTVKTVILTGFNDFKFAQQAIKYGVVDYLLKPVHPSDIGILMKKLQTTIENEIKEKEDIQLLRRHYNESLPILKEKFLTLLITDRLDAEDAERKIKRFNLSLQGNWFLASIISIEQSNAKENLLHHEDADLTELAVLNTTREILKKYGLGEAFLLNDNIVIEAGFDMTDHTAAINKAFSMMEEIRQNIEKYYKIALTIGMGDLVDAVNKLNDSYKTALYALDYRLVLGGNKVIYFKDLEPLHRNRILFDENKENMLVSKIKFGTEKDVQRVADELFDELAAKSSLKEFQLYCIETVACITRLARDFDIDMGSILKNETNLFEQLLQFKSSEEIKEWFREICIKLSCHIALKRQNITQILLQKAKEYIALNYSDNELSIQKLADYLHISASYLSMIFKKEADETFLKYLVNIRIDAAKEFLFNSDLKTMEIAEKVGYPDVNYFSYFFKKNFGMSPREYKNKVILKRETQG